MLTALSGYCERCSPVLVESGLDVSRMKSTSRVDWPYWMLLGLMETLADHEEQRELPKEIDLNLVDLG